MTGSIKTKTPKYKFIIPQFNIATWHDYIEDNFRAIDALFFNIFDIQNFSGSWTKTTEYKKDQVLFIGEDYEVDETGQLKKDDQGKLIVSEFSGRMVKVLKNHTTDNSNYFSLYYFNHKDEYELFADASTAQKFANLAKQYSENAQQSENNAELYKNNAQGYAQEAENSKNIAQQNAQLATNKAELATSSATIAKNSENSAANSATLAEGYKNDAKNFADSAKSSKDITVENVQTVTSLVQDPNLVTVGTDLRSASSNIKNVSSISEQTKNVSNNMSYIKSVDNNKENIIKAVTNEANITTVATDMNNIKTVANNIDIIDNVAWNKSNINNVSVNMPFVEGVSENVEHVVAVDRNKANIDNVATNKTNINNVAENITAVNNVSENMSDVKSAVQSANDAKLWAVGTITEKPEGSSKYWAEQAKNAVQIPDATETVKGIVRLATSEEVTAGTNDSAAITPLKFKQKLDTKQDKSTAVNYNNISNCITYIPQDIKLELNNGTLTLKAGSKVYIPNGFEADGTTPKFDIHIISSDKVIAYGSKFNNLVIVTDINNNLFIASTSCTVSGDTQPTDISRRNIWYDTTTNTVKTNSPSTSNFETNKSLPIAIINCIDINKFTISQVFNGFGYIGSTVYALPGVKGLIPNGRNADGSLKNIEFTLDKVLASTRDWNVSNQYNQHIRLGLNTIFTSNGYVESVNMPTVNNYIMWYNPRDNIMRYNDTNNSVTSIADYPIVEMIELGGTGAGDGTSRITSFTPKTVFHALDYNDKSTISGWSMPSSRYIDLTLGASGSTYAAPANGYLYFKCQGPTSYFYIVNKTLENNGGELGMCVNFAGGYYRAFLPVLKGHTITTYYDGSITSSKGCFIYAEGEQYNPVSSSSGGNEMGGTGEIVGIGGEGEETDPYL